MSPDEARRIVQSLADGRDPISGDEFPEDSVLQHPDIVRALCTAALALQPSALAHPKRFSGSHGTAPGNQGKPWTVLENQQLCDAFDKQTPTTQLAKTHQRTVRAIEARLIRLGKVVPPPAPVSSTRTYPLYVPRSQPTKRNA